MDFLTQPNPTDGIYVCTCSIKMNFPEIFLLVILFEFPGKRNLPSTGKKMRMFAFYLNFLEKGTCHQLGRK
jgi:hypothetical protein